jgi:UDP-N-acetylglucosamine--N-acetylmuramyl-(pentapeptide) pyrophosphoryl-undecaprenol N-acetylglucosamine transferase
MDMAYSASDIIISRAGATTISELCIAGKPAILIPSPNVAEDHQTKNALALVKNEAAIMVPDKDAEFKLVPAMIELLNDEALQSKLSENCKKMALHDSAAKITDEIYQYVKEK